MSAKTGTNILNVGIPSPSSRGKAGVMGFVFGIVLSLLSSAGAVDKNAGTSGAAFLKIGAGAGPAALGEAVTAVVDDANSVAWNAAGLAKVTTPQFTAVHSQWLQGYDHDFVAGAYPFAWGVVGIGFTSLSVNNIEKRAADTDAPDGTFSSNDAAYDLSYGRSIGDSWRVGGGATLVRETLDGQSASAVAGNLGMQWKSPERPWSAGASLRHFGSKIKFDQDGDPLPTVLTVGGAYSFSERARLSVDVRRPQYDKMSYGAGLEVVEPLPWEMKAALRGGYNTESTDVKDGLAGITAGLGVTWRNWGFDMAWAPYGVLGHTFRYALLVKF